MSGLDAAAGGFLSKGISDGIFNREETIREPGTR
jgi:hypothetical protein